MKKKNCEKRENAFSLLVITLRIISLILFHFYRRSETHSRGVVWLRARPDTNQKQRADFPPSSPTTTQADFARQR